MNDKQLILKFLASLLGDSLADNGNNNQLLTLLKSIIMNPMGLTPYMTQLEHSPMVKPLYIYFNEFKHFD